MSRTIAAYQPHYYPRLHYLARARQADVFVVYDDVEFSHRSPQHRAPIDHYDRDWLTIPVRRGDTTARIDDVRVDMGEPWPAEHLKTLVGKYGEDADAFRSFYERLCPSVVGVDSLREHRDAAVQYAPEPAVEECLRWDEELATRRRNHRLDDLRRRKESLAEEIAGRKREDPSAEIGDLVAAVDEVEAELTDAEAACREAIEERNRALVRLSESMPPLAETPFDPMALASLWEITDVDPTELMGDVGLVELTIPVLLELFGRFGVESTVVRSSEVPVDHPGDPSEYQARLTEHFEGDRYLSGRVGYENYLDEGPFEARGIDVVVQEWTPSWEDGNVCALDVLYGAETPERHVR